MSALRGRPTTGAAVARPAASFAHLNEFCARGATAAVERREERERRKALSASGVFDELSLIHI